jgi:hypothetical protein
MSTTQIILLLLGSAGIAALISSLINLISTSMDRKARHRELLMSTAVSMAQQETEHLLKLAELSGEPTELDLYPLAVVVRWHHRQLVQLAETGKLTENLEKQYAEYIVDNLPNAAAKIAARRARHS